MGPRGGGGVPWQRGCVAWRCWPLILGARSGVECGSCWVVECPARLVEVAVSVVFGVGLAV